MEKLAARCSRRKGTPSSAALFEFGAVTGFSNSREYA